MKLRHLNLTSELIWNETSHICELIIESPTFLREVLRDLSTPPDHEKKISITHTGAVLAPEKDIDIIFNPFRLNFSNRRAITTLLKLLNQVSVSEDFYLSTNKLKTRIIKYFDKIINSENFEFEVSADEFTISSLAKAINIHIIDDEDDFVELLTDYMSMMAELSGVKLFVFVNLRSLLTDAELARLEHNLNNHQLDVLLVENIDRPAKNHSGQRIHIDKDLCEI